MCEIDIQQEKSKPPQIFYSIKVAFLHFRLENLFQSRSCIISILRQAYFHNQSNQSKRLGNMAVTDLITYLTREH